MYHLFIFLVAAFHVGGGQGPFVWPASNPACTDVAVSANGEYLYGTGNEGVVYELSAEDGSIRRRIPLDRRGRYYGIGVNNKGTRLAVGTERGELLLIDLSAGRQVRTLSLDTKGIYKVKITEDRLIVAGDRGPILEIAWDSGEVVARYDKNGASSEGMDVSDDGRYILTGNHDGIIQYFDRKNGEWLFELRNPYRNSSNGCADLIGADISPDGSLGVVTGCGGRAIIVELKTGRIKQAIEADSFFATEATFSPNGQEVAVSLLEGGIKVFDLATGQLSYSFAAPETNGLQFFITYALSGRRLVTSGPNFPMRVFDTVKRKEMNHSGT